MGNSLGTLIDGSRSVGLKQDDKPTFHSQAGFNYTRKQRTTQVCPETLVSCRIPPEDRDFCAHLLVDYAVCRYHHWPWVYRCHHEKHSYLNCQHQDYILRMKEYERERRLRLREKRLEDEEKAKLKK